MPTQSKLDRSSVLASFSGQGDRIIVYSDGSGLLESSGEKSSLSREIGRFVLRQCYESSKSGDFLNSPGFLNLCRVIRLSKICERGDCVLAYGDGGEAL